MRAITITAAAIACNAAFCAAQPCLAWRLRSTGGPEARSIHAMAFDASCGAVVLSAGWGAERNRLPGTWVWDGLDWDLRDSSSPPGRRFAHAMAFDGPRGEMVLFGGWWQDGINTGFFSKQTWVWDGSVWTLRANLTPPQRMGHAMAFDATTNEVLLFGGEIELSSGATLPSNDTWTWDGVAWTNMATSGPDERTFHALAYDEARRSMVLFGGVDQASELLGDTWIWDGAQWTLVSTSGPSARQGHQMAYSSVRETVILFGGLSDAGEMNDAWEWDGRKWRPLRVLLDAPSPRGGHGFVADAQRRVIVMFGGVEQRSPNRVVSGETWELVSYADCDASTGVGVLDLFDFLCFQNLFVNSDPFACDCNTSTGPLTCDIFDFLCFQDAFVGGCP